MNSIVLSLNLPVKASSEELRACLIDGTVLLQLLNKLRPGYAYKVAYLFCFYSRVTYEWMI
jgi:kinesin family protein C2/C3